MDTLGAWQGQASEAEDRENTNRGYQTDLQVFPKITGELF
jgi:hypothetical protein